MKPTMTPVESSNLKAIGYDPDRQVLYIEFISGCAWAYEAVPNEVFEAMKTATSVGKFYYGQIKKVYPGQKVEEPHNELA